LARFAPPDVVAISFVWFDDCPFGCFSRAFWLALILSFSLISHAKGSLAFSDAEEQEAAIFGDAEDAARAAFR
jgi:hypothetical protein